MKNTTKIQRGMILLFYLTCYISLQSQNSDRHVVWVHGYMGEESVWRVYSTRYGDPTAAAGGEQREMRSFPDGYGGYPSYNTSEKARVLDNSLYYQEGFEERDSRNIGIGHSFGGLVLRQLDADRARRYTRFGGLITVGTPNDGFRLVNHYISGDVESTINDACDRLTSPLVWSLGGAMAGILIDGFKVWDLCDYLYKGLNIEDLFQDAAVLEIIEGGSYIENLYQRESNIPKISIWGNEDSPVHWRLASGRGDKTEDGMIKTIKAITAFYLVMGISNTVGTIWKIFSGNLFSAMISGTRAYLYYRGHRWLLNSEKQWVSLIGCSGQGETYTKTERKNVCMEQYYMWLEEDPKRADDMYQRCVSSNCPDDPDDCWQEVTTNYTRTISHHSDGFICKDSQIHDNSHAIHEARGVNHFQETNTTEGDTRDGNDEMGRIFNLIWNRPSGDFFHTPKRL